eukprot:CAMPEP_0170409210 /NCGR_PEP_ID=MMETSP0117_2-20130122/29219_1 /TAXON_ID=400756 /ORGANISM="Durinskia baltica, Strain CSIRO CS-38" /LENGTH=46 /DNA_ID= /DNA_START= /DNA_END= /DNA_ORIENTATION=
MPVGGLRCLVVPVGRIQGGSKVSLRGPPAPSRRMSEAGRPRLGARA